MKNKHKIIAILLSSVIMSVPIITFAAAPSFLFQNVCDGSAANPCDFAAFMRLINNVINWFISISVLVAAVTFSIAGGKILMNPENPGKREEAMGMFRKTVVGMIIILVAWLVLHTIVSTLTNPNIGALRFLNN